MARTQRLSSAAGGDDGKQKETVNHADVPIIDYDDPDYLPLPEYPFKPNEPLEIKKQRYKLKFCYYLLYKIVNRTSSLDLFTNLVSVACWRMIYF